MTREYQMCTRCVMDTTDPNITFDEEGVCNHCTRYFSQMDRFILPEAERKEKFDQIVAEIKEHGKDMPYDCIAGISGGVDSTYMVYKATELGLRPLVVHLDNGWDSRLAVTNIERVLNNLGVDLYTHVIDWEEFKDLQQAYFESSVVDIEVASDHAIMAMIRNITVKKGLKYILGGTNYATEGIMPRAWVWTKNDLSNLKDIHKKFGKRKLKTYPKLGFLGLVYLRKIRGLRTVPFLNYIDYNREEAKRFLIKKLEWEDYGGKHHESIFTKFYQSYILPTKFNIDKRKAHLSTVICSGQINRSEALRILEEPLYDETELKRDTEYVLKKFGWSEEEFTRRMNLPVKKHDEYKTDLWIRKLLGVV
ncbi:MAG: N-acetyl sugar amidotransferase [Candidatus Thorarchaeota archaeon]